MGYSNIPQYLEHFLFFHRLGILIPTDFIFFIGVAQPPTSNIFQYSIGPMGQVLATPDGALI
jgi:molybdopterin synthase catalytic subunit